MHVCTSPQILQFLNLLRMAYLHAWHIYVRYSFQRCGWCKGKTEHDIYPTWDDWYCNRLVIFLPTFYLAEGLCASQSDTTPYGLWAAMGFGASYPTTQTIQVAIVKPWPNGPASSRKWTQVELAQRLALGGQTVSQVSWQVQASRKKKFKADNILFHWQIIG